MNKIASTEYLKSEAYNRPFEIWEFTALDKACFRMVIRGTWIFDTHLDVDQLKGGLSKTLSFYPHLAGRMKSQAGITLTNDGVPFSIADEPDLFVEDVLKRDDMKNIKDFSITIKPAHLQKGNDAPLSVKYTGLKNGSVLGIQCSHACMDGDSFYTMVYNWGRICRGESFEKPVLDQSLLPKPDDTPVEEIKAAASEAGWKQLSIFSVFKLLPAVVTGVIWKRSQPFTISAATIGRLKERLTRETGMQCSSNLALSALITKRCLDLYKHDEDTNCSVVTVINTRKRLATIPSTYAGNSSLSIATPAIPADTGMSEIAAFVNQTLGPARKTPSPELQKLVELNLNTMKHKLPFAPFNILGMNTKKPTVTYLNNFSKLHIYDIDFGPGKPVRVIPHNLHDQVLIWPAPPDTGGVEVYFSGVPVRYVNKLETDFFDSI